MVICEKYKFIFLRIPKTASTSLSVFFVKNFCSKADIYTKVGSVNNINIEHNNIPKHMVEKYDSNRIIHLTLNEIVDLGVASRSEVQSKDVIAVLRNRLDRQLSLFFYLSKKYRFSSDVKTFRKMFAEGKHESNVNNSITQYDYCVLDNVNVGKYWRYEDIQSNIQKFVDRHGIIVNHALAHYKLGHKSVKALKSEYYDKRTIRAVEEYYSKDFELYETLSL